MYYIRSKITLKKIEIIAKYGYNEVAQELLCGRKIEYNNVVSMEFGYKVIPSK